MMATIQRLTLTLALLLTGLQGAQAQQPEYAQISVLGEGQVNVAPDIARLSLGVEARANEAAAAMAEGAKRLSAVMEALAQAGLEPRDIQTTRYQVQPEYNRERDDAAALDIIGYTASSQVTAVVRDLDALGGVIDAILGAGGNRFSGISFDLDDRAQALSEARRAAVRDAIDKAGLYAGAAGLALGNVIEMIEGGADQGQRPMPIMAMRSSDSMPVAPGEIEISAALTVRFALEDAK